jgi:AcrR family transcriptional regulator
VATHRPDPEDLTARARIRDAALLQFGEHGFERATIRGIADAAGVSSGLVRHHFGSKQALREACDEYLARMLRRINDRIRADVTLGEVNYLAATRASLGPYQRYLAHAFVEGSAGTVFDEMVKMTEEWLADMDAGRPDPPEVPRRARAAVVTAMALGVGTMHEHISRGLGVELFTPEGDDLLARTLLDVYSHPLMRLDDAAKARAGLDRLRDASTQPQRGGTLRPVEEHQDA